MDPEAQGVQKETINSDNPSYMLKRIFPNLAVDIQWDPEAKEHLS